MKKKELLIVIVSLVVVVVGYLGVQMFTSSDDAFPNHTISVNVHGFAFHFCPVARLVKLNLFAVGENHIV